jgi:isopentenyl diphosphate isomerase/L-lactate dehydrogenase-like FMN-dependent dehydrogenase
MAQSWFQLYFNADVDVTRSLLQRAGYAGYSADIITANSAVALLVGACLNNFGTN